MQLPDTLRLALSDLTSSLSPKAISQYAKQLSQHYRTSHQQQITPTLSSEEEVLAYLAYRLPATFAALSACLLAIQERLPDFQPDSLLDLGAGPGSASWAATTIWPQLSRITLIERHPHMQQLGKKLSQHSLVPALRKANWVPGDLNTENVFPEHDLLIAGYVLGELKQPSRPALLDALWQQTKSVLLFVEPGTPRGFAHIRAVRDYLLSQGATLLAPCPHQATCPMPENDWCHFAQRIGRSRLQRQTKGASLAYEDEKFSYIAFSKEAGSDIEARILRHPQKRGGHIHLSVCTADGLQQRIVTRKEGKSFHQARHLDWGDALGAKKGPE